MLSLKNPAVTEESIESHEVVPSANIVDENIGIFATRENIWRGIIN